MKVQFDLRPAGMVEKERKQSSFNPTRILTVLLMVLFFASSIGYIVKMTMEYFILKEEVFIKEEVIAGLESENMLLGRQVSELKARENVFAETLKIMNDDLPSLEVLNALETNVDDYGIGFNTLRFSAAPADTAGSVVELTGVATSDKQIIDFSDRLRASGVFNDVFMPVTTLNEQTGLISFTFRMPVKPVGEIVRP